MTTAQLREEIVKATYKWVRDAGLDIQDIEPFVDREIMQKIQEHDRYVIGENDDFLPGFRATQNCRSDLRTEQRRRAGL